MMVINKHGSFYLRSGWGTKIINAVKDDAFIFSPSKEQEAVDEIGLGRVMIKALRYWASVLGLTEEKKANDGIEQIKLPLFEIIEQNDKFFEKNGTLLLLHRNLALNKEKATAWYWFFNEWGSFGIDKDQFVEAFHSYLAVNGMNVKKEAVEKEFNCFKNTYVTDQSFDLKNIMDEDTYPLFGPLHILKAIKKQEFEMTSLTHKEVSIEILIYAIAMDNYEESINGRQISIDKLMEEKCQIGKYFNMKYSSIIDALLEADNRGYISLNNNFGNRYIEFNDTRYQDLIYKYYADEENW